MLTLASVGSGRKEGRVCGNVRPWHQPTGCFLRSWRRKKQRAKNTHKNTETTKHTAEMTVQTQTSCTSCTFKHNSCLLSPTVLTQRRGRGLHSREDHLSEDDDAVMSHSAHRKEAWLRWSERSCVVSLRVSAESSHFLNKPPDSLKRRLSVHNDCLIAVPPLAGPQPLQN